MEVDPRNKSQLIYLLFLLSSIFLKEIIYFYFNVLLKGKSFVIKERVHSWLMGIRWVCTERKWGRRGYPPRLVHEQVLDHAWATEPPGTSSQSGNSCHCCCTPPEGNWHQTFKSHKLYSSAPRDQDLTATASWGWEVSVCTCCNPPQSLTGSPSH